MQHHLYGSRYFWWGRFIVMTVLLSATLVAAFIISIVVDATISKTSECECEIRKLKDELAELKDSQKNDINNI